MPFDTVTGRVYFHLPDEERVGLLCQMFPSSFHDEDVHPTHTFNCCEQYMMYRKALVFTGSTDGTTKTLPKDHKFKNLPDWVLSEPDPSRQKYLVRETKPEKKQLKVWDEIKYGVVLAGNMHKFRQNIDLHEQLLSTVPLQLVEAAPNDRVWGIGFSAEDANANYDSWGTNLLGSILMEVRMTLSDELAEVESVEEIPEADTLDFK